MKTILRNSYLLFLFQCLAFASFAQGGLWTHMGGALGSNALGVYGIKGVADPLNVPAGRYQGAFWTDLQGNFWLFGGFQPWGYSNDLWKYDIALNQWTWMNGPQSITDQNGEYGIQGVPSPLNYPSARTFGPNCWTDNNGDFWLYGGYGFDVNNGQGGLSDLWKYNIASNQWTWVSGGNIINIAPVHGTNGVPSPTNNPGARAECKSGWVDAANNLWMFGGQDGATANITVNVRNDLWKYDIAANQWTWMKGDSLLNTAGTFGTKGIEAAANNPPSRLSFTKWKGKDNNFYLFAGGNSTNARNDLWKYNPLSNNWTWVSGMQPPNHPGMYTGLCDPNDTKYPSARIENQTVATSTCTEIFWSFGGFKTISNTQSFNDLWLYNLTTNNWTWVSGVQATNILSNPGPIGVAQPGRYIGSRGGVFIWSDALNNLWIFGGLTYDSTINALGLRNDLWRFQPDSTCFDASFYSVLNLTGPADTMFCPGDTTSMAVPAITTLNINPATDFAYNADSTRVIFNPTTTTTYTITGTEKGICAGKDTLVFTITVVPFPIADFSLLPLESLTTSPDIVFTNASQLAATYEWYYNNQVFSTASDPVFTTTDSGEYCFTLVAYNSLGCSDTDMHCATKVLPETIFVPSVFSPNGDLNNDVFRIRGSSITLISFVVYDRWGEEVFSTKDLSKGWDGKLNGTDAEIGTYYYYIEYNTFSGKKTVQGDINLVR